MRHITATLIGLAFVGCSHVLPPPSVAGQPQAEPIFCGLREALDDGPVRMLIIHGMGPQDTYEYDADLRDGLRDSLDLRLEGCAGPFKISKPDDSVHDFGGVRVCNYRAVNGQPFRTYTLLWSPLSRPYKTALAYDWDDEIARHRVLVNRRLKKELIDQSFSDAVLFAGNLNYEISYSVEQAICIALTDQDDLSRPCAAAPASEVAQSVLVVATHSLGSMALFETLREMQFSTQTKRLSRLLVSRLAWVAMLANQLPLLTLARMDDPPFNDPLYRSMLAAESLFDDRDEPLTLIAFTDPNDLLSYVAPENWKTALFPELANRVVFINYPVSNACRILGVFANPATAHTGYWNSDTVRKALTSGLNCD